jgi:bacterial/archaeal transporter family-2 protein
VSQAHSPASRGVTALAVSVSVVSGAFVALQSRINGEFGLALGNGALAALISFSTGLTVITLVMLGSPSGRAGLSHLRAAVAEGRLPWWAMIGGAAGAFLVLTQGLSAGVLGVAVFSIAVVTGQSLGAVLIDSRGWFGVTKVPLRLQRGLGALIVLAGVVVALDVTPGSLPDVGLLFLLPLIAGAGTGFQQAVNGRVRNVAGSALAATFVNFVVGTSVLIVAFLVSLPTLGLPESLPGTWWLWTGGFIGVVFIVVQVTVVGIVGVLGLGVSIISGQLIGSIILDAAAPLSTSHLSVSTVIGALVTLVGALMVTLGRRNT